MVKVKPNFSKGPILLQYQEVASLGTQMVNSNKRARSRLLKRLLPTPGFTSLRHFVKDRVGLKNSGPLTLIENANLVSFKRPPLSEDLRAELVAAFTDDLELLASCTQLDLSAWIEE
ncbi:MAG: hypothetical protein HN348_02820 [Proteobacteria bacterium]|jgi:hypothetical protein|nr:hypothetical protein [Pseudomonadota bacterium]